MKIRLVILSVACFSCLVPPAVTAPVLAAKALAALGALKGAAVLGGGALLAGAKGLALKGLAAKGALVGGAAALGAKALKAKAALSLPKSLLPPPLILEKPVMFRTVAYPVPQPPSVVLRTPSLSNIFGKLMGAVSASKNAVVSKTAAVGGLLGSLLPSRALVSPPVPFVYEVLDEPKFYELPTPIIEKIVKK